MMKKYMRHLQKKAMQPMTFLPGLVIDAIENRRERTLRHGEGDCGKEDLHGQHARLS